jgi:hypothetical protein
VGPCGSGRGPRGPCGHGAGATPTPHTRARTPSSPSRAPCAARACCETATRLARGAPGGSERRVPPALGRCRPRAAPAAGAGERPVRGWPRGHHAGGRRAPDGARAVTPVRLRSRRPPAPVGCRRLGAPAGPRMAWSGPDWGPDTSPGSRAQRSTASAARRRPRPRPYGPGACPRCRPAHGAGARAGRPGAGPEGGAARRRGAPPVARPPHRATSRCARESRPAAGPWSAGRPG